MISVTRMFFEPFGRVMSDTSSTASACLNKYKGLFKPTKTLLDDVFGLGLHVARTGHILSAWHIKER